MTSLSRVLLSEKGLASDEANDLEAFLVEELERAAAAWHPVHVEPARFMKFLASRLQRDTDVLQEILRDLRSLDISGLYLACACADGDPASLAVFEKMILSPNDSSLRKLSTFAGFADEVKQRVRTRLFVGATDGRAKIEAYRGRGDLASFARGVVLREALTLRRPHRHEVLAGEIEASVKSPSSWRIDDPEVIYLRKKYEADFAEAFRSGIAGLPSDSRNLLRYHYVNRLSIDHIGSILGIHRANAARRLNRVRDELVTTIRQRLRQRLQPLPTSEFDSILRLIEGDVDVSLGRALAEAEKKDGPIAT